MAKTSKTTTTGDEETVVNTSTDTPESDRPSGAGNPAGPAGLPEAIVAALVERSGCADAEHMIDMAVVGLSLMEAIEYGHRGEGPLKGWSPANSPVEVVADLCDQIVELEQKLAFSALPADVEGKRGFVALSAVRLDNVLHEIHSPLWLTLEEHAELVPSLAVDPVWDNGIRAGG